MLTGTIILEDISISFRQDENKTGGIVYTVSDSLSCKSETKIVAQDKFFKALAIAVHNDGMPDYKKDYEDAESIQSLIRWIP